MDEKNDFSSSITILWLDEMREILHQYDLGKTLKQGDTIVIEPIYPLITLPKPEGFSLKVIERTQKIMNRYLSTKIQFICIRVKKTDNKYQSVVIPYSLVWLGHNEEIIHNEYGKLFEERGTISSSRYSTTIMRRIPKKENPKSLSFQMGYNNV